MKAKNEAWVLASRDNLWPCAGYWLFSTRREAVTKAADTACPAQWVPMRVRITPIKPKASKR